MSELVTAEFWSDFDGTAVRKYGIKNPRNWLKYPLPGIDGYVEFVEGVRDVGVEVGGAVTIRKKWARGIVTSRSIRKLSYSHIIKPDQVVYAGNEEGKGQHILERSEEVVVGMIDDNPHKLGKELLKVLQRPTPDNKFVKRQPILLGVVDHSKSDLYMDDLAGQARELATASRARDIDCDLYRPRPSTFTSLEDGGFRIASAVLDLQVVQLEPYSEQAGRDFGQRLLDLAA